MSTTLTVPVHDKSTEMEFPTMLLATTAMLAADPAFSTWLPPVLMLIGVTFLGVIMALAVRNHRQAMSRESTVSRTAPAPSRSRTDHGEFADQHLGANIPTLPAELLSSAQRLATSLDYKSHQIEELLAAAEQRIAELSAIIEQSSHLIADERSLRRNVGSIIESRSGAARAAVMESMPLTAQSLDPLSQAVYRLADAGRKPVEIARELHEQTGKIELILALRNV